jgi:hypothetical protein
VAGNCLRKSWRWRWIILPYFVSLDNPPISGINSIPQIKFWLKGGGKGGIERSGERGEGRLA